jgi:hypothetical protein
MAEPLRILDLGDHRVLQTVQIDGRHPPPPGLRHFAAVLALTARRRDG